MRQATRAVRTKRRPTPFEMVIEYQNGDESVTITGIVDDFLVTPWDDSMPRTHVSVTLHSVTTKIRKVKR